MTPLPPEMGLSPLPADLLRQAIDAAPGPIAYIDATRRYRFVNRAHEDWFGQPRHQVEGRPLREVLGETTYAALCPQIDAALAGERVSYERAIPAQDGGPRRIRVTLVPSRAPDGTVAGFFARAEENIAPEAHYRELWENAQDILYTLDLDGRLIDVNRQIERLTGYPRAELLGRPIGEFILPDHHDAMRQQLARKMAGEPVTTYELALRTREGGTLIVEVSSRLINDAAGQPVGIQGSARDVTARGELEAALRTSEERLRLAASVAGFGTYDDRGPGQVYWSPELHALFGLPADARPDEGPRTALELIHPDDRGRWLAALEVARDPAGSGVMAIEHRLVRPDGRVVWVAQSGRILFEGEGDARRRVRAIGVVADITARKEAEAARDAALAEVRAVLASVADGITAQDPSGRLVYANLAAARLIGYPSVEALLGAPLPEVLAQFAMLDEGGRPIPPGELPGQRVLRGEPAPEATIRFRVRATGEERWAIVRAAPVRDAAGQVQLAVNAFQDITARKRAETEREGLLAGEQAARAEAQAALAVRDEFLASVSHDLRTPLTGIRGLAQLLARRLGRLEEPQAPQMLEQAAMINQAAGTMAAMVDELLDLTRLEAGQPLELRRGEVDLVALARAGAQEHGRTTPRHVIRVAADLPALIGRWDRSRLERVLGNLLSNAVKYSPDGGEIVVTVRSAEGPGGAWAELTVTDQGVGIPAADLPHIFERFRRGANVVGRVAGAGLGLAGARRIVEQHGGTIAATSAEGAGTTIIMRLPLAGPDGAEPGAEDARASGRGE